MREWTEWSTPAPWGVLQPRPRAASPVRRMTPGPPELVSHYTRAKYLAEREASRLCREDEVPVVIVNPTATVGPWDVKPTPIGMLVLRFLRGRMPAYIETGLNLASVEDVAQGHLLALEKGRVGERYILGGSNLRLKEFLDILGAITGRRAPWLRVPKGLVALVASLDTFVEGTLLKRTPSIPLEGFRHGRRPQWVGSSKAVRELGYPQTPVEEALEKAVAWLLEPRVLLKRGRPLRAAAGRSPR